MRKIDRFIQYLEYKGISENKATVDCGLSVGLIGKAKAGRSDLGDKAIDKVLAFYQDLNRVWLLTGSGQMLNAASGDIISFGDHNVTGREVHDVTIGVTDFKRLHELEVENASLKARLQSQEDMIAFLKSQIETLNKLLTK